MCVAPLNYASPLHVSMIFHESRGFNFSVQCNVLGTCIALFCDMRFGVVDLEVVWLGSVSSI